MGLLSALSKIQAAKPEPFVAPVLEAGATTFLVVQNDAPFRIRSATNEPGWWLHRPFEMGGWTSRVKREAYPGEYLGYLDQLPRWYVVIVHRLGDSTWLCIPLNQGDAHQRGWLQGAPRALYLVRDTVRTGDAVEARQLGPHLLYGQMPLRRLSIPHATAQTGLHILVRYKELLRERQAEAEREAMLSSTEGQLRNQVEFLGGSLLAWEEVGDRYEVIFSWQGHQVRTYVNRELRVESVGFCAAGTEGRHTLASIVGLLQYGVRTKHYAVEQRDD